MIRGITIAGTHSGSGKTTMSLGIMGALAKRCTVVPFKIGPDYIDPAYHKRVSGGFSYNLDIHMLGETRLKKLFQEKAHQGDIAIVEGVMGLFDGKDSSGFSSSAHIAKLLGLPVILVIDAGGLAKSASAMVMGYRDFDQGLYLAGVLLNRIGGEKHFKLLKECIETDTGIPVLGFLPKDKDFTIPERPLGLIPPEEIKGLESNLSKLYCMVEKYIDLEKIIKISEKAGTVQNLNECDTLSNAKLIMKTEQQCLKVSRSKRNFRMKIAVAVDDAFCFYYRAGLELLEAKGANLTYFSPLKDSQLPDGVSGLYLGGGFPENFAQTLSENKSMRISIFKAIEGGLTTYAEGGGLMYLMKAIRNREGKKHAMVGIFNGEAVMTDRLQNFGYVTAEAIKDNVLAPKGSIISGHEFHYSKIVSSLDNTSYIIKKPGEKLQWQCGYTYKNCLATYMHIDFYAYPELVANFLSKCI